MKIKFYDEDAPSDAELPRRYKGVKKFKKDSEELKEAHTEDRRHTKERSNPSRKHHEQ